MVNTHKISWYIHDKRLQILTMINSLQIVELPSIARWYHCWYHWYPIYIHLHQNHSKPQFLQGKNLRNHLGLGIERLQHLFPSMDLLESMLRFSQRFFGGLSNHRLLGWLMSVESLWKSFGKWCFVDGPEQKITCLIDFHDFPARLNVAILGLPYVRFVQCDTSTTRYRLVTTVQKRGLFCSHDWHVGAIKVPDPGLLC